MAQIFLGGSIDMTHCQAEHWMNMHMKRSQSFEATHVRAINNCKIAHRRETFIYDTRAGSQWPVFLNFISRMSTRAASCRYVMSLKGSRPVCYPILSVL